MLIWTAGLTKGESRVRDITVVIRYMDRVVRGDNEVWQKGDEIFKEWNLPLLIYADD